MTAHTPIIETVGLTKTYPGTDFRAVDELNLRVGTGEVFGLLGPNGAGKTTTVGVLTTRVIPTAGQAFVGGIDVVAHPTLAKQLIGVVSQQNTLDRQLTPWENLYFHGRLFGMGTRESRQTADELLERFQLTRFAKASVYALSGGMAQRLMVARAIFHRPAVLFLDEPTAGLDPQGRLALWDLLRDLNADGQTIMLTTHYMEEADKLCGRVAIMDHGKILALDTPSALKQSVGADTIVTVKADGDPDPLAENFTRRLEGVTRTRTVPGGVELQVQGSDRLGTQGGRGGRIRGLLPRRPLGGRAHPRDSVHRTDRKGPSRLMSTTTSDPRTTEASEACRPHHVSLTPTRSATAASWTAPALSSCRDLVVLRKHLVEFTVRTLVQPFLLCFVFLYVFPKIGQGIGAASGIPGAESAFATVLVPGVVGLSIMFQGIQAVAMQLAQEFGFTREIEDRVQAPCPIWLVAISKVISGGAQGLISAIIVLPIASVVHAAGVEAQINLHWLIIVTMVPLACAGHDLAGSAARHALRAAQPRSDVRLHRVADHLPRRHVLRVDPAGPRQGRGLPLAPDHRAGQSAHLRQRRHASRVHQRGAHASVRDLSSHRWRSVPLPHARPAQLPPQGSRLILPTEPGPCPRAQ